MLMPKRVKHRKQQRGRMGGQATRGATIAFGEYGLKAMEPQWITNRQIEAARVAITRHIKRAGKLWIRVFPGQAGDGQAGGNAHGQGQGESGVLGRGREAGARALRARRRSHRRRATRPRVGGLQAPVQNEVRPARRGGLGDERARHAKHDGQRAAGAPRDAAGRAREPARQAGRCGSSTIRCGFARCAATSRAPRRSSRQKQAGK